MTLVKERLILSFSCEDLSNRLNSQLLKIWLIKNVVERLQGKDLFFNK